MPCKCTIAGSNCASTASAMGAPANTVFPFVMPALCAKQCNSWNNIMLSGGCTATFSQKSGSTSCIPPNFDNIPAAKLTCEGSAAACDCVSIMGKHYDCDDNGNGSCQDADNGPHDHGGGDHGGGGWNPPPTPSPTYDCTWHSSTEPCNAVACGSNCGACETAKSDCEDSGGTAKFPGPFSGGDMCSFKCTGGFCGPGDPMDTCFDAMFPPSETQCMNYASHMGCSGRYEAILDPSDPSGRTTIEAAYSYSPPAPSPQNQSPTPVCDDDCKDKAKTAVTGLAIGIIIVIVIASLCGLAICVIIIKCIMAASAPPAPVQQPTYVMKTGVQMQGMQQNPMVAEAVVVQQVPGNPRKFESAQTSSVSQI